MRRHLCRRDFYDRGGPLLILRFRDLPVYDLSQKMVWRKIESASPGGKSHKDGEWGSNWVNNPKSSQRQKPTQ